MLVRFIFGNLGGIFPEKYLIEKLFMTQRIISNFVVLPLTVLLFVRPAYGYTIKSNIVLQAYSPFYAEACNECVGPTPHHCARATQLPLKKCCTVGEL